MKKLSQKDKSVYAGIFIAFVLICLAMGFACFQYYLRLQETVKEESSGYMSEISKQMGTNVRETIDDNYSVLETVADMLEISKPKSYEQLQPILRTQQELWGYKKILLVDAKGVAYDGNGESRVLISDSYLQETVVEGHESMSSSQIIDGREYIIFAVPLSMKFDGMDIRAVAAIYDLETFDTIISMTAFDGKGYAHIVREDGTVVIRSSMENAMKTGYNVLNSLSDAEICSGSEIDEIRLDLARAKSGQTEFKLGDDHEYMTYSPLGTQNWSLLIFLPVAVVNAKSHMLLNITLLICSFVTISFALLVFFMMVSFHRNRRRLERIAYVDSITNGNTIERFYELAQDTLRAFSKPQYALIYMNIEKFKVLNEQFGRNACDEILRSIEVGVGGELETGECMGRLFADNFCILVEYRDKALLAQRLDGWYKNCVAYMEKNGKPWLPLIIDFGVYVIANDSLPLTSMIDRAKLALTGTVCEIHGKLRYSIYDEQVRRTLFREKQLEDMMEDALNNNEYEMYLQPKFNTQTEKIGGAEALVRWISPSEGMIYPDEFIPIFEKNGFVIQLDRSIFEQTCRTLRRWLDEGKMPVKISVNCSRTHLKNPNFLEEFSALADAYGVPHKYIEIELTENVVFEDVTALTEIINNIHLAGFGCSMDDFGSGYSSLNLIQDIPVDTLKLDKVFFRGGGAMLAGRTESVVGGIITMAKALSMETVAEGIESREHVDMLKKMGCDFIQGFYFARPMPVNEFEAILFETEKQN